MDSHMGVGHCGGHCPDLSPTLGQKATYLLVGVGTPEDAWLTMVSFILVRGRGGLKENSEYY